MFKIALFMDEPVPQSTWRCESGLLAFLSNRFLINPLSTPQKSPYSGALIHGGERGIRTLDGLLTHTPLAGERLQPLGHLSNAKYFTLPKGSALFRASCPTPLRAILRMS